MKSSIRHLTILILLTIPALVKTARAASPPSYANITNYDSIIVLATNGTKNYSFTHTNGLSLVVAVTMTPFASNSISPAFTLLDNFGSGPTRLGIDGGLGGGDGNWIDYSEGVNFSVSLVSYFGIVTNSIQFRITGIGVRPNDGVGTWTSSAQTNSLSFSSETLYALDTNAAPMAGRTYTGQLRRGQYQLSNLGTLAGQSIVLNASFITGNGSPGILLNPTNQSVNAGSTASFSADAAGDPMPSVQWQVKTNGGSSFAAISGATNLNFSFTAAIANNGNQYRALFTNTVSSTATASATLTVNSTTPSVSSVVATSHQFQFSVTGAGGISYIVQAATNLAAPIWIAVQTNTAPFTFTDPVTNAARYYRVMTP